MKLYYCPGTCSLSPHIILREAELPFTLVRASIRTHKLDDGTDYRTIHPRGYVPVLEFDNGERLSEGPAIVQWIADQVPDKGLAPAWGTMARYRLIEWLNFISSEVHKGFSVLFNPAMPEEAKALMRARLIERFRGVDSQLAGQTWLMGETFTVADAYLFVCATWGAYVDVDLSGLPNVRAWQDRVASRPSVQEAMQAEGLLKR